MFSLTIVFGSNTPVLWTLLFKTEERAKAAYDQCLAIKNTSSASVSGAVAFSNTQTSKPSLQIEDDFSQMACICSEHLNFMLEDMDRSQLGQIEKALHDRRAQVKFEALANADPGLRQQQRQPSMPILQPMGNGFRPVS